jgi:hypothetical protein
MSPFPKLLRSGRSLQVRFPALTKGVPDRRPGYLPQQYEMNIGNLKSIEDVRSKLMSYRARWAFISFRCYVWGSSSGWFSFSLRPRVCRRGPPRKGIAI